MSEFQINDLFPSNVLLEELGGRSAFTTNTYIYYIGISANNLIIRKIFAHGPERYVLDLFGMIPARFKYYRIYN